MENILYMIADLNTKTRWAVFDEGNKSKMIDFFDSIKNDGFTVITYKDYKEIKRESYIEFSKSTKYK